jgi:type II secretory pathway pseudopilin PulG
MGFMNPTGSFRRRRGGRLGSTAGFTLIESTIMIGVVTIGMASIVYLMAIGQSLNMDTRDMLAAYGAANELVEYYRQQPFAQVTNASNQSFGVQSGQVGYNDLSRLANPQGLYTIVDYGGDTSIKQLTVTVNWSRRRSTRDMSVSVTTLIAQHGLNDRWN